MYCSLPISLFSRLYFTLFVSIYWNFPMCPFIHSEHFFYRKESFFTPQQFFFEAFYSYFILINSFIILNQLNVEIYELKA